MLRARDAAPQQERRNGLDGSADDTAQRADRLRFRGHQIGVRCRTTVPDGDETSLPVTLRDPHDGEPAESCIHDRMMALADFAGEPLGDSPTVGQVTVPGTEMNSAGNRDERRRTWLPLVCDA